jgi:exodeoxyribonuclease V alpha subunit
MTQPRPMPPLFAPALVPKGSPQAAVLARLAPFHAQGVLASVDMHVAAHLARKAGALDPDLVLALALAVRAPRKGHICVELDALRDHHLLPAVPEHEHAAGAVAPVPLVLPREGWAMHVAGFTSLVRGAGEPDRPTPFVLRGTTLYTDRYHRYQRALAQRLLAWVGPGGQVPLDAADLPQLRAGLSSLFPPLPAGELDLQRLAAALAVSQRLTVITGGPGMGKTWTVRNLLALLWLEHRARHRRGQAEAPDPVVALAAPTGKAAARMRESLRAGLEAQLAPALGAVLSDPSAAAQACDFLQGLEASTLHRLLGWRPDNPTRFRRSSASPIPADIIVVDEASMVDFALMAKLVDAVGEVGPGGAPTRLVLLGDRHQLASVEAGTVLADLCGPTLVDTLCFTDPTLKRLDTCFELGLGAAAARPGSGVRSVFGPPMHDSMVQLRRTHRFSAHSGIGRFALACLSADFQPAAAAGVLVGDAPDVQLFPHGERRGHHPTVRALMPDGFAPYLRLLRGGFEAVQGPGFPDQQVFHRRVLEAFGRFRVLCAHRQGSTGVTGLNRSIIGLLRDAGLVASADTWWLGRPVLVRRNDYSVRLSSGQRGLYNGDIGLLVQAMVGGQQRLMVAFPGPDTLPGATNPCDPQALALTDHAGKVLVHYVDPARLPEHSTAFAMTIHKSQGSEFEHVCVVLPRHSSPLLTRELVYTGVTRAKARMSMVGERSVLEGALASTVQRASGLAGELW